MSTLEERSRKRRETLVANSARNFAEAEEWDRKYWQSLTPEERSAGCAGMRRAVELVVLARDSASQPRSSSDSNDEI